ncbi:acyl-CoA N-acyltransferase [Syncephalastrum racemosum]|uniref:Acyl-CoA N-acyltransferase n=1 Tax=Syncephalastrum racemosum TaxID=13706 RepID=A0A1X2H1L8_SYNRA|nr:acyl-CoA N-acyltransferase [Syncephalastrum racemosum]
MTHRNPVVALVTSERDLADVVNLRTRVYVIEQGFGAHTGLTDEKDPVSYNLIARCDTVDASGSPIATGVPVGAVRLYPYEPNVAKLERLVVLSEARGLRIGSLLVTALEEYAAKELGMNAVMLEAIADKRAFYEKLEYAVEEDVVFIKEGVDHYTMWKRGL